MINNSIGIFVFRKDLRLHDNLGLIKLSQECNKIIPIFILDDYQIEITNKNKYYRSNNAIQFMCESLIDLDKQLNGKLNIFKGNPIDILEELFKTLKNIIKLDYNKDLKLGFNCDYTKYALERDNLIVKVCNKYNISVINEPNDITLIPINKLTKNNKNEAYINYGAFYKNAIKNDVNQIIKNKFTNYIKLEFNSQIHIQNNKKLIKSLFNKNNLDTLYINNIYLAQNGGRTRALQKINNKDILNKYNSDSRDLLTFKSFEISAALNFGCISIREFYHIIKLNEIIAKQLYWRDYYLLILLYIQNGNSYTKFIDNRFNLIKWENNHNLWKLLIESKTGFLIIDAAMRELIKTGYIGNRTRLLLATFWIKYLIINPFHPKYGSHIGYSYYLVDCNASQNKLNHQWFIDLDLSGRRFHKKGCHSLTGRMMRIDNEVIKKFDPECIYIKKWLPELKNIPNKDLYKWNNIIQKKYNIHYSPIFNWEERYRQYCKLFKDIK